jgi:MFS family permease
MGTLLALATFGVGYVARPIGAFFMGHMGDKFGRRTVLVFTLSGTQGGQLLATLVFIPVAALPEEQLLSWGWRVPFWMSIAVAVVGYVIRRKLDETPAFELQAAAEGVVKLPLAVLMRDHWADVLRVIAGALVASVSTIFTVWALSYATSDAVGMDRSAMLWVGALANLVALAAIPLWATLSDRIGRRPVYLIGAAGSAVTMFLYLWAISTGSYPLILLLGIIAFGVVYSAANGVWPSFYGEMFSTRVRLSGMAIGTQIGFAVAGFAVTFAAQIAGPDGDDWSAVAFFTAALCVPPIVAALSARETAKVPTEQLGERASGKSAERETVAA